MVDHPGGSVLSEALERIYLARNSNVSHFEKTFRLFLLFWIFRIVAVTDHAVGKPEPTTNDCVFWIPAFNLPHQPQILGRLLPPLVVFFVVGQGQERSVPSAVADG